MEGCESYEDCEGYERQETMQCSRLITRGMVNGERSADSGGRLCGPLIAGLRQMGSASAVDLGARSL